MLTVFRPLRAPIVALTFAVALGALGCHAQTPSTNSPQGKLSPELARRVEVLIRSKSSIPPAYTIQVGTRSKSEVPGFDEIQVTVLADGKTSQPIHFLLSTDNKTLAQFSKYDISKDPKDLISADGRPARGGPANAPVLVVGFDDLECPYCARMHEEIFPALTARYKDQIHIVYLDFPLPPDMHPWAMRAAVDVNCLAAQSPTGYWNLVDFVHAHAGELGGEEKSLAKANVMLDSLTRDEGKRQKVNADLLNACIAKQDDTAIKASVKIGEDLGVDATPTLFVNGEKLAQAVPIEDVYRMIDDALTASGHTPPPPPPAPIQTPPQTPPVKSGS